MRKIKIVIKALDFLAVFVSATVSILSYPRDSVQNWTLIFVIQLVMGILLIISVILMRWAVNKTNFAQPNEALVTIHVINFVLLISATFSLSLMQELEVERNIIRRSSSIQYTIMNYTNIFLLYLIGRFLRENRLTEQQ